MGDTMTLTVDQHTQLVVAEPIRSQVMTIIACKRLNPNRDILLHDFFANLSNREPMRGCRFIPTVPTIMPHI